MDNPSQPKNNSGHTASYEQLDAPEAQSVDQPEDSETKIDRFDDPAYSAFDPANVSVSRISGSIFNAFLSCGAIAGTLFLYFYLGMVWQFFSLVLGAFALLLVLWWFAIFWPAIDHRHRGWRLSDVGLELHSGVWFRSEQAVPWARVQHADVSQGPIQRAYGIGTLTVHTAGTMNSSISLEGMNYEKAIELRDKIIRQRKSGDVV